MIHLILSLSNHARNVLHIATGTKHLSLIEKIITLLFFQNLATK